MIGFYRNTLLLSPLALALCLGTATAQLAESENRAIRDSLPGHTEPFSLTAANQLQIKGQVYAYATRDSLYLGAFRFVYPVSSSSCTGYPWAGPRFAHAFPGPRGAGIPPIALLTGSASNPNPAQATVAYVVGGTVYRYKVSADGADRLSLSAPSTAVLGQLGSSQVLAVASARDAGRAADDSSVMVSGTGGYFRHVHWSGGRFGDQAQAGPLDESIRHMRGGVLAGVDGHLFAIVMDAPWPVVGEAGTTAPDLFDEDGALWRSGDLLVREGKDWIPFKVPAGSYRAFRLFRNIEGLSVRLYPDRGPMIIRLLGDRPTSVERMHYRGREIAWQTDLIRERPYFHSPKPETLFVQLADPDGNIEPPVLELMNRMVPTSLTGPLVKADPPNGCQPGGICLSARAPWFHVILDNDSVRMVMKARRTAYFPGGPCPGTYSADTTITVARAWSEGDAIRLKVGDREGRVHYTHVDGILRGNLLVRSRGDLVLDRRLGLSQWPWAVPKAGLSRAMLFAADGRPLGLIGLKESLAHLPAGTAFLCPSSGARAGQDALPVRLTLR